MFDNLLENKNHRVFSAENSPKLNADYVLHIDSWWNPAGSDSRRPIEPWGTGVTASPLGKALGVETDRAGRVVARSDLSIRTGENIFVVGDMASFKDENGKFVPGVAPAAMQQAETVARNIPADLRWQPRRKFKYKDRGNMATIGRNAAIAQFGRWAFDGFFAWLLWLVVHVFALIDYRSRLAVLSEWMWAYFTRERSARLITGDAADLAAAQRFIEAKPPAAPAVAENARRAVRR